MKKVIAICNKKGGVGKTTVTANLAAALGKLGKKVLVIDLDSQCNLSGTIGAGKVQGLSSSELLYFAVAGQQVQGSQFIHENDQEGISYIPGSKLLDSAPSFLATHGDGSTVLREVLEADDFDAFDYILLDCRPCLDLVVVNALAASDGVIIPVEPEEYAVDGLLDVMDLITQTHDRVNPKLHIMGILVNRAVQQRNLTKKTIEDLRNCFGEQIFNTIIPFLAEAPTAASEHRTCVTTGKKSRLGDCFVQLAQEVMEK